MHLKFFFISIYLLQHLKVVTSSHDNLQIWCESVMLSGGSDESEVLYVIEYALYLVNKDPSLFFVVLFVKFSKVLI
jgi:hypothetical protein